MAGPLYIGWECVNTEEARRVRVPMIKSSRLSARFAAKGIIVHIIAEVILVACECQRILLDGLASSCF